MMVYGKLAIVKDSVDDDLAEFAQWFSSINLALIFHRWFDRIPPEIEQKYTLRVKLFEARKNESYLCSCVEYFIYLILLNGWNYPRKCPQIKNDVSLWQFWPFPVKAL